MNPTPPNLSPAQIELLAVLFGECAEVIQAVSKIQRHGFQSRWPKDGNTNRWKLADELGHLANAVQMMVDAGEISEVSIDVSCNEKRDTIAQWLHHQA